MKGNLIMSAENMRAFERSIDLLDSSIREIRQVANNIIPEVLFRYGLDTALRDVCMDISKSGVLQVKYQSTGLDNLQIEQATAIALFYMVRELMNNLIRHTAAQKANVQLSKTGGQLILLVEDDGRGIESQFPSLPQEIYWQNIRNRVDVLKGKIDIQVTPGKGSTVMIILNT